MWLFKPILNVEIILNISIPKSGLLTILSKKYFEGLLDLGKLPDNNALLSFGIEATILFSPNLDNEVAAK